MKATQKMMDFFQQAEQMLTEERPFNKDRWQDMVKYLRTTHLFKKIAYNHVDADGKNIKF